MVIIGPKQSSESLKRSTPNILRLPKIPEDPNLPFLGSDERLNRPWQTDFTKLSASSVRFTSAKKQVKEYLQ